MNKTLLTVLVASFLTPLALAEPVGRCDGGDNIALGIVEVPTPAGTFYVDDRNYVLGNGIWIYQESNTIDHLQRGGASPYVPDDAEICTDTGDFEPDTLIF